MSSDHYLWDVLFCRNFVNDIHQKSNQLLTNSQKPQGSVQPVGYDLHVTLNEMKEGLNIVKVSLTCWLKFIWVLTIVFGIISHNLQVAMVLHCLHFRIWSVVVSNIVTFEQLYLMINDEYFASLCVPVNIVWVLT